MLNCGARHNQPMNSHSAGTPENRIFIYTFIGILYLLECVFPILFIAKAAAEDIEV